MTRFLSVLDVSQIHSLEQFNTLLTEYIRKHNRTFHTGINEAPVDRYLKTKNYIRIPRSREWLEEAFYNRVSRTIDHIMSDTLKWGLQLNHCTLDAEIMQRAVDSQSLI